MDSQQHNGLYRARLLCEIHLNISDQCIVLHKGPADGFVSLILGFRRDSQKSNFKIKFLILGRPGWLTNTLNIGNNPLLSAAPPSPHTSPNFPAVVPHYPTLGDCSQHSPALQTVLHEAVITTLLRKHHPSTFLVCSSLCSNFQ